MPSSTRVIETRGRYSESHANTSVERRSFEMSMHYANNRLKTLGPHDTKIINVPPESLYEHRRSSKLSIYYEHELFWLSRPGFEPVHLWYDNKDGSVRELTSFGANDVAEFLDGGNFHVVLHSDGSGQCVANHDLYACLDGCKPWKSKIQPTRRHSR